MSVCKMKTWYFKIKIHIKLTQDSKPLRNHKPLTQKYPAVKSIFVFLKKGPQFTIWWTSSIYISPIYIQKWCSKTNRWKDRVNRLRNWNHRIVFTDDRQNWHWILLWGFKFEREFFSASDFITRRSVSKLKSNISQKANEFSLSHLYNRRKDSEKDNTKS